MRYLLPSSPTAEASAAAMLKAVVNAMTLNHGLDATAFVRGFILEENPIRIGELRTSIATYKGVNAAIIAMGRKLEALRMIGADLDAYEATLHRKTLENWIARRARWLAARATNRAHEARIADARRMMAADREDLDLLDEVIREIGRIVAALAVHQARTGGGLLAGTFRRLDERDGARVGTDPGRHRGAALRAVRRIARACLRHPAAARGGGGVARALAPGLRLGDSRAPGGRVEDPEARDGDRGDARDARAEPRLRPPGAPSSSRPLPNPIRR